ncbi:hypothetical protein [Acidovorax sp.]|uniref:hypothetical protein n=1 Tax=Acidovorax sp. TaxID=1872122 RepID=UPI0031D9E9BB
MSLYTPGQIPQDAASLVPFLYQELQRISRSMSEQREYLYLAPLSVEPSKRFEGLIVLADGTNWNPGAGAGYYGYHSNAWNKLG